MTHAVLLQCAYWPSSVTTYWPVVHAVAGEAVTPVIGNARGGLLPAGVQLPGVPAVAPVAAGPALLNPGGGKSRVCSVGIGEAGPGGLLLQPGMDISTTASGATCGIS